MQGRSPSFKYDEEERFKRLQNRRRNRTIFEGKDTLESLAHYLVDEEIGAYYFPIKIDGPLPPKIIYGKEKKLIIDAFRYKLPLEGKNKPNQQRLQYLNRIEMDFTEKDSFEAVPDLYYLNDDLSRRSGKLSGDITKKLLRAVKQWRLLRHQGEI